MTDDMQRAIRTVRTTDDPDAYLAACLHLVRHRGELAQKVYINVPQGDARWDEVRGESTERCGCGVERVIEPVDLRTEYEPADGDPVVVEGEVGVYLRPVGGDKTSCYMKVWIEQGMFTFLSEPFAPFVLTPDLFSRPGYPLDKLDAALRGNDGKPAVMVNGKTTKIPIFGIFTADPSAGTVSIRPDKDVEVFDPDAEADAHACG